MTECGRFDMKMKVVQESAQIELRCLWRYVEMLGIQRLAMFPTLPEFHLGGAAVFLEILETAAG